MWPFKSASESILDAEDEAWQLDVWRWMFHVWGGAADFRLRELVLPTHAAFPSLTAAKSCDPNAIFADVARLARMDDQSYDVVEETYSQTDPDGASDAAASDQVILYRQDEAGDAHRLTLRFALELAALKIAPAQPPPPAGRGLEDCVTDLAAVYLGFGVFGVNAAIQSEWVPGMTRGMPGRAFGRSGFLKEERTTALREADWTFALAMFLALKEAPIEPLLDYLKADLENPLRQAMAYLKSKPDIVSDVARTE
ncbi:MAG TPA: hypothetical protein VG407_05930 [Caulobacteraceae bacterium]|jgi:hypothetical protein|nr:hypothetical protein [Caulobacteraceae bacterium]